MARLTGVVVSATFGCIFLLMLNPRDGAGAITLGGGLGVILGLLMATRKVPQNPPLVCGIFSALIGAFGLLPILEPAQAIAGVFLLSMLGVVNGLGYWLGETIAS